MLQYNFGPKNVHKGTNSDGTKFRVDEYDFNTYAGLELGKLAMGLLCFGLIAPFVSVIFFLCAIWNFDGRSRIEYPMCILLSTYFLFDAFKGWVVLCLVSIFFDENQINWLLGINAGIIICSLYLWIFGHSAANIIGKMTGFAVRWLYMVFFIAVSMFFGCYQVNKVVSKHPDWVNRNLEIGDYVPEGSARMKLK